MAAPALRIIVDGDSNKIYRKGEKVTGRVILVVEEEEQIQNLGVVFAGNCITKTSRPFHVNGSDNSPSRRQHEEKIRLFNHEKELVPASTLAPKKYTWTFEFTFPESTEPRYKRLIHGANYLREPHPLPPTFLLKTNVPGGAAQISYFVQARYTLGSTKEVKRCRVVLPYHPTPQVNVSREAKCTSSVLYGQSWKPEKDESQRSVNKVFSKVSRRALVNSAPRIIPSIIYPESVAPGQHIPISLVLRNTRDAVNEAQGECTIDSLSITISTYSTTMCGHGVTQPEDIVSKHVTCIARTNMNKTVPFGTTAPLTTNFRLVDDVECVPTFKTYTITRRYTLGISICIKFGEQNFTIRSTTPLEIVPRVPRSALPPSVEEGEDIDPLPLYTPREPSKEFAPSYEEIFALSRMYSSSSLLAPTLSRGSSYMSDVSAASGASTPASEIEEMGFGRGEGRVAVPG
ncbi:hypothetical protein CC86DRAFT_399761 [Ophiobolus disseminans]|uniref:Arrestin-like N-terminal domain-containing protein n=1 Tax=Ophiobolus disseminans TaxID=1469910 RepID=A0A6A7AIH6_9PLEO|nr:hypothetical protein CC86DRAFT_399761 [Ophiobolus disseminans]